MSWDKLQAEAEAVQSLLELYDLARKTRRLHDEAHLPIPERLQKFMASESEEGRSSLRAVKVPPPPNRKRPATADDEWMWVEARSCTPTTLIPAVIRESPLPLSGQQVIDRVQELNSLLNRGSIYNAANRLVSNGMLERSGDWKLRYEPAKTPLLQEDGTVWGPESMFQAQEKAAHRREAILYILERYETGLMVVQLVEQLKNCSWMKALANKDLVKQDVKKLFGDGKIRKVGNTQKWVLVTAEKGE